MKTLILGVGNLLLTDEGFGVHCIRHLEEHYRFGAEVDLVDGGTLGLLVSHALDDAGRVYVVDAVAASGEPGSCVRYGRAELLLNRIPAKLSPHQVGVQEMLLVSDLRGNCPGEVHLLGVIPAVVEPGTELSPVLRRRLPGFARDLVCELRGLGHRVEDAAAG